MKSIIYSVVVLWGCVGGLNYCEIEKVFCNEHDHVACFNTIDLPSIYDGNLPYNCTDDLLQGINERRRENGLAALSWNKELEILASLTTDLNPVTCGISMKFRDVKLLGTEKRILENFSVAYSFSADIDVLDNPDATDIGCSCKKFKSFVFCWYNSSKRSTKTEYYGGENNSFLPICNMIHVLILLAFVT